MTHCGKVASLIGASRSPARAARSLIGTSDAAWHGRGRSEGVTPDPGEGEGHER